jgi:hypothetical protein
VTEVSTYLDSFVEHPEDLLLRLLTLGERLLLMRGGGCEEVALLFLVPLPLHRHYWVSLSDENGIPELDQMVRVDNSIEKEGGGVNIVFFEASHLPKGYHFTPF